jgi:hypothetical protein
MSKHEKFILTPITCVLEEMNASTSGIGNGIDTFPLNEYILQSTFINMTGFQEQKIKCIDWELATNDFDYRFSFVEDVNNRGTYSKYNAKDKVYNALLNEILRYSGKDRDAYINEISKKSKDIKPIEKIQDILEKNSIVFNKQRNFNDLKNYNYNFENMFFVVPNKSSKKANLLEQKLSDRYTELYRQRNRIAHNTLSYQRNLPDFDELQKEDYLSRNYFFWFAILYLIDEIFIKLFEDYLKYINDNSYFKD